MSNIGRRQQRSGRGHSQELGAESQLWNEIVDYLRKLSSAGDDANEGISNIYSMESSLEDGNPSKSYWPTILHELVSFQCKGQTTY